MSIKTKKIKLDKKAALFPYHVFSMLNEYFVYHIITRRFYKIDETTAKLLEMRLGTSSGNPKKTMLPDSLDDIAKEVSILARNGLFDVPSFSVKRELLIGDIGHIYSRPISNIELGLTECCNLACKYCYCKQCRELPNNGLMSEKIAKKTIDWLFKSSRDIKNLGILFFGGEPLLNKPVISKIIGYSQRLAKRHGKTIAYSMTTNGTLLDDEFMALVEKYTITVMVSLDGKKDVHDAQCPTREGRGSYDMAAAGARRLLSKQAADVRCTMTHPMPNLKELVDFFEQFGFKKALIGGAVNIPSLCSSVDFTESDYADFSKQNEAYIPELIERLERKQKIIYNPFVALLENIKNAKLPSPVKCGAGHSCIFAAADGALYPCHRFGGMDRWRIGHISSGVDYSRYKEFWVNYRRSLKHTCEQCWAWPICQGPCPWEVAKPDGTFEKKIRHCDFRRAFVEQAAYIYAWQQNALSSKDISCKRGFRQKDFQPNRC